MFKFLMEIGIVAIIVLILVTQVLIPLFISSLDFFWFFKRKEAIPVMKADKEFDVKEAVEHLTSDLKAKRAETHQVEATVDEVISTLKDAKNG